MDVIWMLVIGVTVGIVATLFMPEHARGRMSATITLGIAGSFIAGILAAGVGWYRAPLEGVAMVAPVVGAMLLLFLYGLFAKRLHRA